MKANKINKTTITKIVENAVKTTKNAINNTNEFALKNTEDVALGTIDVVKQWQDVTTKALDSGFKLIENQQNIVFDSLESFKKQFIQGKNKFSKIFA